MIIKLSNNIEYPVISTGDNCTRAVPSGNANVRSKMYVYMADDAMTLTEFAALFTEENLETVTLKGDGFETIFSNYTVVQSVGRELVTEVDTSTGETVSEYRLLAKLEQLTYTEQKLKALGV